MFPMIRYMYIMLFSLVNLTYAGVSHLGKANLNSEKPSVRLACKQLCELFLFPFSQF